MQIRCSGLHYLVPVLDSYITLLISMYMDPQLNNFDEIVRTFYEFFSSGLYALCVLINIRHTFSSW